MKKVLVTGANGFVGSAVCRELDSRGIRVSAVVRDEDSAVGRIGDIDGIDKPPSSLRAFSLISLQWALCDGQSFIWHCREQ